MDQCPWLRFAVCAFAAAPLLLALLMLMTSSPSQAMDVTGEWVIAGTDCDLSNETINVTGAIVVRDGGELHLDNCLVSLDFSTQSQGRLTVNASGRLHANGTRIVGATGGERLALSGDTEMDGCYVACVRSEPSLGSIICCSAGNVTLKDTVFERIIGGCVYAGNGLSISGCTLQEVSGTAIIIDNRCVTARAHAVVVGSSVRGINERRNGGPSGIYVVSAYPGASGLSLIVDGTVIEDWSYGIQVVSTFASEIVVEGCELFYNMVGIKIKHTAGTMTVRRNMVGECPGEDTIGMDVAGDPEKVILEDNVIESVGTGYWFRNLDQSMPDTQCWRGLDVRNCSRGVHVINTDGTYSFNVEINGSRFKNIRETFGTFVAEDCGGSLCLWVKETEHMPGSATVLSGNCYLYGYLRVGVEGVRWLDGPDIHEGGLTFWDANPSLHYIDISRPRPLTILSWQVKPWSSATLTAIDPHMELYGWDFDGVDVGIESGREVAFIAEIIDDMAPVVTIDSPVPGSIFSTAQVEVRGSQSDVGTGLSHIELTMDQTDLADVPWTGPQQWSFLLTGLGQGLHVLGAKAVDRASNVGGFAWTAFTVDTIPPTLDLRPWPAIVNNGTMRVEGLTEVGSNLTVNDIFCPVGEDGTFSQPVALEEGNNVLMVRAVDHAGNVNSTILKVVCDTQAPILTIAYPLNGTWTNASSIVVTGYVSLDASLEVNGAPVAFSTGRFSCELWPAEGEFEIAAKAVDRAGNEASTAIVVNVDWTPPRLEVFSPDRDVVHTTAGYIEFFGEVQEASLAALMVNGAATGVFMGRFLTGFSIDEGVTSFVLEARDLAGNSDARVLTVHRDITLPNCAVKLVPTGGEMRVVHGQRFLTVPGIELEVVADEDVMVALGDTVEGPCREWTFHLTLEEGLNALVITVHDLAGNMVTPFSWLVVLDTMTPRLEVRSPQQGLLTSRDSVVVEGLTEPGAVLTIMGRVQPVDSRGFFRVQLPLRSGLNVISVTASDAAGNVNGTVIEVTREKGFGHLAEDVDASTALAAGLAVVLIVMMLARHRSLLSRRRAPPEGGAGQAVEQGPDGKA